MITEPAFAAEHLQTAVEIAAAISSLPAVATQDWCARAAAAMRHARPQSIVSVSLAVLGSRGTIVQLEATGAVGTDPFGRSIEGEVIHPEHAPGFDWWIHEEMFRPDAPVEVGLLREMRCFDRWQQSPSGRRWSRLGVTELIVGVAPMAGDASGRAIIAEVGPLSGRTPTTTEAAVMKASLPLLVRRATLAFGTERSTAMTRLTHREQQVLEHLSLGKSVKQIASDLARSPHTVHDHVKSLHRKLNASSRGELIARALGHLAACGRKSRGGAQVDPLAAEPTLTVALPALMSA